MFTRFKQAKTIGTQYIGNQYISPPVNSDSIFLGQCDSKPHEGKAICLSDDDLRQHMLIIGNDNVGFLRNILEQVIKKEQNIFCLKPLSIETLTYLTRVANENGVGEQVLIFSENKFNPVPKLPFDMTFNILEEEWGANWIEIIKTVCNNNPISCIYEMFEFITNKVISTRLLQIAHSLCEDFSFKKGDGATSVLAKAFQCSQSTIVEFIKSGEFTSKETVQNIIFGLTQQESKFRFILSIRENIGEMDLNDIHERIWSNIFINYKVFFSEVKPEVLAVILGIFKHCVYSKLGGYKSPANDKDVYQEEGMILSPTKTYRRNLCIIDYDILDAYIVRNSMGNIAMLSAQARGLGFQMIYTSAKLSLNGSLSLNDTAIRPGETKIIQSIIANTNTKVIMDRENTLPGKGYTLLHKDESYHVTCNSCWGIDLTGTVYNILISA